MKPYSILNAMAPTEFLKPETFRTGSDREAYGHEQHAKGVLISLQAESVSISCSGTWGAHEGNGVTTSCEGIGYHANTADLLRGFLDGPAPVRVYRWDGPAEGTEIKPRTCPRCGKTVAAWIDGGDCPKRTARV
jgi:hypothetical protein